MTYYIIDSDSDLLGHFLKPDALILTPEHIDWAIALSHVLSPSLPTEAQQWQTYLDALALVGFAQWIEKHAPELDLRNDWLSGFEPREIDSIPIRRLEGVPASEQIDSLRWVRVGDFRLYLTVTEVFQDGAIALPQRILDSSNSSDNLPHFFVLMEVLEDIDQVRVYGHLRQDQLIQHQQTAALALDDDHHYSVPLAWFDPQPESLLLLLRCVEPEAIALRTAQRVAPPAAPYITSPLQGLTQRAINVGRWLNHQLDELAQELSWVLLPPPALSPGLRSSSLPASPVEPFDALLTEFIQRSDLQLPADARGAYRNFEWEGLPLRLYVVTWETVMDGEPTWGLLLFLGAQPNASLPLGIQLEIHDDVLVLEQTAITDAAQDYLYACVLGNLNEQFWATIRLTNGASTTLPPFRFVQE
ncbi:DUF1822 family protein [Thermoleptolyngbya sichuanensis A183]|uniref:DUF1822 family protein n=1 Tax=Thermoleptolyngbya sichuanensis A183 TaxID=2737172 RepID=A0A6M8BD31_9CYAN|nr:MULTISPECIES: DUF1822 family protein [Thermoleptolyngbya]QKD82767.1 DUF1822 family protein [Thermoleptolyngbya sichuanensis A183]